METKFRRLDAVHLKSFLMHRQSGAYKYVVYSDDKDFIVGIKFIVKYVFSIIGDVMCMIMYL